MLKIDKSNWKRVKLSDVVFKTEFNDKINAKNLYQKFIKAEHLDAESINIKKWGNQQDEELPPTFYKIFKKKQILYPTRNPHLRRAALAHFDGICGEKTLTLSINDKIADERFIIFLLHSNSFYSHTTNCIVGSTNPHVRWRDVANYEFLLPPKTHQAELAELLWGVNEVIEKDLVVLSRFEVLLETQLKRLYSSNVYKMLRDLCNEKPKYGSNSSAIVFDGSTRYLRITDIGKLNKLNKEKVSSDKSDDKYLLEYGDFLLARSADPGRSYYYVPEHGRCIHAGYLIKFKLNLKIISPEYLYLFTQTAKFKTWVNQTTRKGTLSNINSEEFGKMKVPYVGLKEQSIIVSSSKDLLKQLGLVESKLASSKALQKSIINQLFDK